MNKITLFIFAALIILFEYGCSPVGVIGSGAATTMVIAEDDRTVGGVIDDTTIKLKVSSKFLSSDQNLFLNIDIRVTEGRVLLIGIVKDQETRVEAVRRTWQVEGVTEVINEIEVGDRTTIKEYANDVWITTQVKAVATQNIGLRALSYNFETIRGKVYIAGLTTRKEQLDTIIKSIENIKGVKEIVNYVIIKE